jgi:hypothetical protein
VHMGQPFHVEDALAANVVEPHPCCCTFIRLLQLFPGASCVYVTRAIRGCPALDTCLL